MKNKLIAILLALSTVPSFGETPLTEWSDDFKATITTSLETMPIGLEYRYRFAYAHDNTRDFGLLSIHFPLSMSRNEILGTGGEADRGIPWVGGRLRYGAESSSLLYSSGIPKGRINDLKLEYVHPRMRIATSSYHLKPGEQATIFLRTRNQETIPGIADLLGVRNSAMWVFRDWESPPGTNNTGFRRKTFKVPGPVIRPTGNPALIDHLIAITKESRALGWISKDDVYRGLMDKLEAARPHILKGGTAYTPARNILGAFRNQLAAQRGKAVETACAAMLDINAAELIKALGG